MANKFGGVLLMGLLLCVPACGEEPIGAASDVAVPSVGSAGAMPAKGERRVDVTVFADGTVAVDGVLSAWDTLEERLIDAAGGPRPKRVRVASTMDEELEEAVEEVEDLEEEVQEDDIVTEEPVITDEALFTVPDDTVIVDATAEEPLSNAELLLDQDEWPVASDFTRTSSVVFWVEPETPWHTVARALTVLANPRVMLYRTFFAVRSEASGTTRAVAVFLPRDKGLCGVPNVVPSRTVRLRFERDGPVVDAATVGSALHAEADGEPIAIDMAWNPHVPMRRVVVVLEAALRAGAVGFVFTGGPVLEEPVALDTQGTWGVTLGTRHLEPGTTAREGADWPEYQGFANAYGMLEEEIEEEFEEPLAGDGK